MALGPRLFSKDELKKYIMRRLGAPVINIEITDEQLDDAIADTLDEFLPRAYSGVDERYIPLQLSPNMNEYILPYNVFAVLGVYSATFGGFAGGGGNTVGNPFSMGQFIAADIMKPGLGKVNLLSYELAFEQIATMELILGKTVQFDYNTYSKILHFHSTDLSQGSNVLIHVYKKLTPETGMINNPHYNWMTDPVSAQMIEGELSNIFDQKWIRKMSTERARYQWAMNLLKYQGSVLPNGGTLNGEGILAEAKENIEKLTEELHSEFELPPDFFVG